MSSFSQKSYEEVDINKMIGDLTKVHNKDATDISMIIWFPNSYWHIAGSKQKNSDFDPDMMVQLLESKMLFAVVAGEVKTTSNGTFFEPLSENEVRKSLTIMYNGKAYFPVKNTELSENLNLLKQICQPLFKSLLGSMGEGLNIFYFDMVDENGDFLIDEYENDSFSMKFNKSTFNYNLPLPSLYPDKTCPIDQVMFPSNYQYCPFHGNELEGGSDQDELLISPPDVAR